MRWNTFDVDAPLGATIRCLRGFMLLMLAFLAACTPDREPPAEPGAIAEPGRPIQIAPSMPSKPRISGPAQGMDPSRIERRPEAGIYPGSGQFVGRTPRAIVAATPDGDITLNFAGADVRDVAKAVLGELLKVNYVLAPAVQGMITLQTNRPIAREAVLPALEAALRFADVAIVVTDGVYRLVPMGDAPRQGPPVGSGRFTDPRNPGFGLEVVSLRFVSAEEMQRTLEQFAPQGSILRADTARNLLIIAGSEQERANLLEYIAFFDVDWLAGMSFGLFPLKLADAKSVAAELTDLLGPQNGPTSGLIRLVPIERMNAILAISARRDALVAVQTWVDRLDRGNERNDQQLYVYYVQNGRATDLATVLTRALSGDGGSGGAQASPRDRSPNSPTYASDPLAGQMPSGVVGGGPAPPSSQTLSRPAGGAIRDRISSPGRQPSAGESGGSSGFRVGDNDRVRITPDETNNALLILGTAREFALVEAALRKLDIQPLQVLIEAVIAEVTLTDQLRYGVQYMFQSGNFQGIRNNLASTPVASQLPGLSLLFSTGGGNRVVLNLLEQVTNVNVVSSPQIIVLNNQTATLQVGDQVPIATQSAVSVLTPGAPVVNTIQFRDTGVILQVTPRVNDSGLVLMDVAQEVSDVAATTTSTIDSPTIQQRKINSSVAIRDRETVALGGLIRDNRNVGTAGTPWLQDIPVMGALFGDKTNSTRRTELLVLITPHVIRGQQDAREVTDELRRRIRAGSALEQRMR